MRRSFTAAGDVLKGIVRRSPLAGPARSLYRRLSPLSAAEQNDRYDEEAAAVMRRVLTDGSNCLDVGAHSGSILRVMLSIATHGRHMAFEPLPHFAAELRRDFPQVQVYEVALSDTSGDTTFEYVVSNPAYSGLRRRQYDRPNEEVQTIRVPTARLDDLIPNDLSVAFIKIDVEGGELQVLRGGLATLRRCRPFVVFEHGRGAAESYGTTPAAVYAVFAQCGLQVSLMQRWLAGKPPLTRSEFIEHFDRARDFYFLAHP
jgi:FkbM family methyltransferase